MAISQLRKIHSTMPNQRLKIPQVKYLAIADPNAEFNQYQANNVDITNSIPTDRYKRNQGSISKRIIYCSTGCNLFYDFNMMRP